MKKLLLPFAFLLFSYASAQYYSISYVEVAAKDVTEFENKEMSYWSKVAQANIEKGNQIAWSLNKKVGTAGTNSVNYAFVNVFDSLEDLLNPGWDAAALGFNVEEIASPYKVYEIHSYKVIDQVPGENGKYSILNYARPKNLSGFMDENITIWKAYHKENIQTGATGMTSWGMGARIYPIGNQEGATVMTWDSFDTLESAFNALDISDYTPPKGSKMNEYDPDGFMLRVIWEQLMIVN